MSTDIKKIAVAGTVLADKILGISAYPEKGQLTQIQSIKRSVGGCVPNVAADLKALYPDLSVYAIGKIGQDDDGDFISGELNKRGVDTASLTESGVCGTSFTDVMSVEGGQRTFFTYAGACGAFGFDDIPFDRMKAESVGYLHLGYFLLLDKIDGGDGLKILREAARLKIETSVDLVSENSDRYKCVLPCLPYTDNLIINEIEAGKLTDTEPTADNAEKIARKLKAAGVVKRVIIHSPEFSVCMSGDGFTKIPSLELPDGFIKGSTGAGDAFCAGCIASICKGKSDAETLSFASYAAAAALSEADAISGMRSAEEITAAYGNFKRKNI